MGKDVIIACDFSSAEETLAFLDRFPADRRPFVKIGMELYYAAGPDIVRRIKERGHRIFLDLKLHDIPNTVKKAMAVLSRLDVDMVNVHAAGTRAMMEAALEGLTRPDGTRPLLIAVTQLTSTGQEQMEKELLIPHPLEDVVAAYARGAMDAGLDVTPGVRFADAKKDDQTRITTPAGARDLGSDYIVVGRPITQAEDPCAAYARCVADFVY